MSRKVFLLNRILLLVAMAGMLACYGPFRESNDETNVPSVPATEAQLSAEPQEVEQVTPDSITIEQSEPTPENPGVNFEGISFTYDPSLAQQIVPTILEASTTTEEEGPWWEIEPRHVKFDIQEYPLQDTFHEPHILVYPAEEFASMSESGQNVMDLMKTTLAEHAENPERLPFLPPFNAGPLIRTQFQYLDFKNGSGFRYVTQFGQAINEINNHELFYTFQGLTTDQQYYVAAVLPLNSPLLPAQATINGDNYMQFEENFETYIADLKIKMDAEAPEQFTPSLSILDALFASMQVK
jgi:hypothetical protein